MPSIVSVGEVLLDLAALPLGTPLSKAQTLRVLQGGSPANVATGLAQLGVPALVVGAVGRDDLGRWLQRQLASRGVDVRALVSVPKHRTGVVFLSISSRGERHFLHAREGTADACLAPALIRWSALRGATWLHISSGPLRTPAGRRATRMLLAWAREQQMPVSLDVNLRPGVWPSLAANVNAVRKIFRHVDVLKANEEEARALTGCRNVESALGALRAGCRRLAIITRGPAGALALADGQVVRVRAPRVRQKDATGAGDAFMAGALAVLSHGTVWDDVGLKAALELGCLMGARACTALGATAALPGPHVLRRPLAAFLRQQNGLTAAFTPAGPPPRAHAGSASFPAR